jgi:hypothetical protein
MSSNARRRIGPVRVLAGFSSPSPVMTSVGPRTASHEDPIAVAKNPE